MTRTQTSPSDCISRKQAKTTLRWWSTAPFNCRQKFKSSRRQKANDNCNHIGINCRSVRVRVRVGCRSLRREDGRIRGGVGGLPEEVRPCLIRTSTRPPRSALWHSTSSFDDYPESFFRAQAAVCDCICQILDHVKYKEKPNGLLETMIEAERKKGVGDGK